MRRLQVKSRVLGCKSKGFTIVEILVATSITITSATALAAVYQHISKHNLKMQLVSEIVEVESALTTALINEDSYSPAARSELANGNVPSGSLTFSIQGHHGSSSYSFSIAPGGDLNLSRSLSSCSDYPSPSCPFRVRLAMRRTAQGGFAYAYKIGVRHPQVSINYSGAGVPGDIDAPFMPSEFTFVIPQEFYRSALSVSCPTDSGAVAFGSVDPETGRPTCIYQSNDSCPDGTLPKKMRFNKQTNRIEFDCGRYAKSASCPKDYLLSRIDTASLDADSAVSTGYCVFFQQSHPVGPLLGTVGTKRISGEVCPPGYESESTCNLVNITATAGTPYVGWCDSFAKNCSAKVESLSAGQPHGCVTRTIPRSTCASSSTHYFPPQAGTRILTNSGRNVDCYVQRADQNRDSQWDADVQVQVICKLVSNSEKRDVQ